MKFQATAPKGTPAPVALTVAPTPSDLPYPRRPDGTIMGGEIGKVWGDADLMQGYSYTPRKDGKGGTLLLAIPIEDGEDGRFGALHLTGDSVRTREGNAGTCHALWAKATVALEGFPCPVTGRKDSTLVINVTVSSDRFIPSREQLAAFGQGAVPARKTTAKFTPSAAK